MELVEVVATFERKRNQMSLHLGGPQSPMQKKNETKMKGFFPWLGRLGLV